MFDHINPLEEAQNITDQIVAKYHPRKVVLFGSVATDKKNPNDIDLLVIKDTSEKRIKRVQDLYKLINWSFPLDIVVRTPEEVAAGVVAKNEFYTEALKGKTLYEAN